MFLAILVNVQWLFTFILRRIKIVSTFTMDFHYILDLDFALDLLEFVVYSEFDSVTDTLSNT